MNNFSNNQTFLNYMSILSKYILKYEIFVCSELTEKISIKILINCVDKVKSKRIDLK